MRHLLLFVVLFCSLSVMGQNPLTGSFTEPMQKGFFTNNNDSLKSIKDKKWSFSTYSGFSTSFSFFNGGNATIFSAPIGLQLDRRLNNNFYAFAGASVAPSYIAFNRSSFLATDVNKIGPYNGFNSNNLGLYSRVDLGLMYVNDAKTFSISGSIGVQRSTNPFLLYQPMTGARTNGFFPANR